MTNLYRHFDDCGRLLYVGVYLNAVARLYEHMRRAHWAGYISRVEVERHETREAAKQAERHAIEVERPYWNNVHGLRGAKPHNKSREEWGRVLRDRFEATISADYGSPVTRQTCNGRYGNPKNPKPVPT